MLQSIDSIRLEIQKMIYRLFLILGFLFLGIGSRAQERYQDQVFEQVEMQTYPYFSKPDEDLLVDVYQPQGDTETRRPLLLYVHGGGFAGGERDQARHQEFCQKMAKKGYVSATMDYTLVMKGKSFSCDRPADEKIETFLLTARDISRAVRFFIEKRTEFGIDTTQIVLLGSSAGAEAVAHAVYWPATRENGEEVMLSKQFRYGGLVSMAGALASLDFVDVDSAVPTQLFHGTCDNLVPYGQAPHHYCNLGDPGYLILHGAYSIAERLKAIGMPYYLVTGCRGAHEWNATPLWEHLDKITDFVYQDVLKKASRQIHLIIPTDHEGCPDYPKFNFCVDPE